jgi:hypothetical protein
MKARKPKVIEVGKCYRLNAFWGLGDPSEMVVYVYAIDGVKQRYVRVEGVAGYDPGWGMESYSGFLRRVHSEVPTAKN